MKTRYMSKQPDDQSEPSAARTSSKNPNLNKMNPPPISSVNTSTKMRKKSTTSLVVAGPSFSCFSRSSSTAVTSFSLLLSILCMASFRLTGCFVVFLSSFTTSDTPAAIACTSSATSLSNLPSSTPLPLTFAFGVLTMSGWPCLFIKNSALSKRDTCAFDLPGGFPALGLFILNLFFAAKDRPPPVSLPSSTVSASICTDTFFFSSLMMTPLCFCSPSSNKRKGARCEQERWR
mmetsp:Transcript_12492/g.33407  ORF Transcript_12492/g.33407 Transcript_12492/m.33407 type:complete len:233 (-) Transcript_12492:99-797(-)